MSNHESIERHLRIYAKKYGGPMLVSPAEAGATHICNRCKNLVRAIGTETEYKCPVCETTPSLLALGTDHE